MTTLAGPDVQPGTASSTSAITVRPLQPTIGAEIGGIDLGQPLSTAARGEIKAAILQYKVVFFRDQDLDRDQHAAFARQFGPLYVHPSVNKPDADQVPAAHRIAAADAKKYADLFAQQQAEGWDPYHSDTSWRLVPTWGAVLRAVTLPEVGGDTIWVDAGLAYDGLPVTTTRSWPTRSCAPTGRPVSKSSG
jgi:alpha-ketoglutarate-dependent taurine dioxygenase